MSDLFFVYMFFICMFFLKRADAGGLGGRNGTGDIGIYGPKLMSLLFDVSWIESAWLYLSLSLSSVFYIYEGAISLLMDLLRSHNNPSSF